VLRNSIAVALAVGAYGLSFGALAVTNGFSVVQALAVSTLTFTGGSQFALVSVLGSGGGLAAGVGAAWLLSVRNAAYGMRLAPVLRVSGPRRLLAAQLTVDESTAMALAQPDNRTSRLAFWSTGAGIFVAWNIATLAGAVGASLLGDPATYGLDAAVPAALLALVWPQLRRKSARSTAAAAAIVALLLTPFLAAGWPVLMAGMVAVVVAWPDRELP